MYATEFKTVIKEPYISVAEFERFKDREVRVIIIDIDKEPSYNGEDFMARLVKNPKQISEHINFLSRDEANER